MNPYQRETDWHGLYGSSRDDILRDPASVSHPAKMSLKLLSRIIAQMQEWGWLRPGSCLVDPFAGTFSTGITWAALHPDNRACGIELEGHFVAMGRQNQAHAEKRLGRPLALTILRGDSRHVAALLAGDLSTTRALVAKERAALEAAWRADWSAVAFQPFAGYATAVGKAWVLEKWGDRGPVVGSGCVGSPPYGNEKGGDTPAARGEGRTTRGQRPSEANGTHHYSRGYAASIDDRAAVSSPPYNTEFSRTHNGKKGGRRGTEPSEPGAFVRYGDCDGQIEGLPDAAACGSPPYADSVNAQAHGIDWTKAGPATGNRKRGEGCKQGETFAAHLAYGSSPGQIGALPDTAACGSPPYADSLQRPSGINVARCERPGKTSQAHSQGYAAATSPPFEAQRGSYQPTASGPLASQALFDRHAASNAHDGYGENPDGQIGTKQAESYSDACLAVYQGLADAGVRYLALVVKCPTRDGKLRRLDQLTARLLRAAGYRVCAWRRAWLFEEQAQAEARHGQGSLFGEEVEPSKKVVGRLSFFRRLHLAKGGVAAKHEDVYFAELVGSGEGAAVASPPFNGANTGGPIINSHSWVQPREVYGTSEGQIGNLRDEATP